MKNAKLTTIVKIVFFTAVIALAMFGTVLTASAQERGKGDNIEVKYLGAIGNHPIFQVEFDNLDEEEIHVSLKDAEGNTLYAEKFKEKKFLKRFQLNRPEEEDLRIVLTLTTKKGRFSQQYQINRNTRIVEDVTVTRL